MRIIMVFVIKTSKEFYKNEFTKLGERFGGNPCVP